MKVLNITVVLLALGFYTEANKQTNSRLKSGLNRGEAFIVGGEDAVLGEFPYQVAVVGEGDTLRCSGAILNEYWVVTSASCVNRNTHWKVHAGALNLSDPLSGQHVKVIDFIRHPRFGRSVQFGFDIALLKLGQPLKFSNNVYSIDLPNTTHHATGRTIITGWGQYKEGGESDLLKKVDLEISSDKQCQSDFRGLVKVIPEMICAGGGNGIKSGCHDTGAPWVDEDNKILIGIWSWSRDCAHRRYRIIGAEVAHFVPWIHKTIERSRMQHVSFS